MLDEEAGHRVHDPRLVRAGKRDHVLPTPRNAHPPTLMLLILQLAPLYATMMPHEPVRGQGSRVCTAANGSRGPAAYPLWYGVGHRLRTSTDSVPRWRRAAGWAVVLRYEQLGCLVMGTPGREDAGPVQSVDRAVAILEILARDGEAGVTEVARELGEQPGRG